MDGESVFQPVSRKDETITDLLGKITTDSATLVREEVHLARQEMTERLRSVKAGALTAGVGAFLAAVAFLTIWAALMIWLCSFWPVYPVLVIAGVVLGALGAAVIFSGVKLLRNSAADPVGTVEALQGRECTDGNQRIV
jgi:uncharacterized membrane protein YqjE